MYLCVTIHYRSRFLTCALAKAGLESGAKKRWVKCPRWNDRIRKDFQNLSSSSLAMALGSEFIRAGRAGLKLGDDYQLIS